MNNLSFWAQSLDNQSPDLIFQDGEELSDDELRQKLVLKICAISKRDIKALSTDSAVNIHYSGTKFVIEVIPKEKDKANRLAPVIIYGELPKDFSENWAKEVRDKIEKFTSNTLKRTLEQNDLETMEKELNEILKKKTEGWYVGLFRFIMKIVILLKTLLQKILNWLKHLRKKLFREQS